MTLNIIRCNEKNISGDNELAQVEFLSKTQVLVTYQPTLQQQAALSDGGVSGQFIVQYDVERFNDAGEILVSKREREREKVHANILNKKRHLFFTLMDKKQ